MRPISQIIAPLLIATLILALNGCGFIAGMAERMNGKKVVAEYHGLANKSLAIVVYADPATYDEFPTAREDITLYLNNAIRKNMPTTRLLNLKEVTRWQDDTINWYGMTEKDIGRHFSVDRVLYIEVLAYSSRMEGGYGDLQGRLRANCKVFECDVPGNAAAWSAVMDITWPEGSPLDPNQTSELAVRKHTVEVFTEKVIDKLYDHKEFEKSLNERNN